MVITPISRAQSPKTMFVMVPEEGEDREVGENSGGCRGTALLGRDCVKAG